MFEMKISITFIVFLLRNVYDTRCARCVLKGNSTHVHAELMLDKPKLNICDVIIQICPQNMTSLSVTSESINSTYPFSLRCLSRRILPRILTFSIDLVKVELCSNFSQNFSSNLRELYLKGCGITALPRLGTFYGFDNLQIIDLSNNLLREVPQDLLRYSPLVKKLDLSSNRIVLLPYLLNVVSAHYINVMNNTLDCSCTNAWVQSQLSFTGYNCKENLSLCSPSVTLSIYANEPQVNVSNNSFQVSALSSALVTFGCRISSSIFVDIFWVSPIGVIPVVNATKTYAYTEKPVLAETSLTVTRLSNSSTDIIISNARGHLSGIWYCIGHSPVKVTVSPAILLNIYSGLYQEGVYSISLYYGFSAMFILLLVGIIGGTIRYCSETHCLQRPQPSYAYGGKTFIGVIPVPDVDGTIKRKRSHSQEAFEYNESIQFTSERRCNLCNSPPSYWFCDKCETIHYVESIFERVDHPDTVEDFQCGVLSQDGKINIIGKNVDMTIKNDNPLTVKVPIPNNTAEARPLIITEALSDTNEVFAFASLPQKPISNAELVMSDIYVRSNNCVIRLGQQSESSDVFSIQNNLCCHYSLRRTGADVKLVVSNEKLAEEYRQALDGLASAVAHPDPTRFREGLEEFRNRLRRDVGHGVKVLRGEFQDLRAKSAKGVASLRNQSSAAAQRMRAGLTHSMEQMKDSMRSVAELCGATGTVGQTISVVSIYKDENDNTLKERFVSDFVF